MSRRRRQWIHMKQIQGSEGHMASIITEHYIIMSMKRSTNKGPTDAPTFKTNLCNDAIG